MTTNPQWLSEEGLATLQSGYLREGESVSGAYMRTATAASDILNRPDLIQDFFDIQWKGWLGLASAALTNFGADKGLPISCNGSVMPDSITGIFNKLGELAKLSQNGAGLSCDFSEIRATGTPINGGGFSIGVGHPMKLADLTASYVSQNGKRPGVVANYLNISHPDAYQVLLNKDHLQGDHRLQLDSTIGFIIEDMFMHRVLDRDPDASKLWGKLLETNLKTGSPYIIFIDTINKNRPSCYQEKDLFVRASNLCTEITLFSDPDHTFVCCLCSLNANYYSEWEGWLSPRSGLSLPQLAVYMLDAVLSDYIAKASKIPGLECAVRSAKKERAIGVGVMGLHSLYQQLNLPFNSPMARRINNLMFSYIERETKVASEYLGRAYGIPEWCTTQRNSHTMAVAPTRSNSVITGAYSEGINPIDSNVFVAKQNKGTFVRKNPWLEKLLEKKGQNTPQVWDSINENLGSVLHLPFLSWEEKQVFLTAREINPYSLIEQAGDRQYFIDQSQSFNRWVHPHIPPLLNSKMIFKAWKAGLKTMYYTRSSNPNQLLVVKDKVFIATKDNCPWCDKAKELLAINNMDVVEFKQEEIEQYHYKTYPQIWLEGYHIGGYKELELYMKGGNKNGLNIDDSSNYCKACEA